MSISNAIISQDILKTSRNKRNLLGEIKRVWLLLIYCMGIYIQKLNQMYSAPSLDGGWLIIDSSKEKVIE
ncbi:hypothetical protein [Legionella longbeachae]|uniref:hypothetical protein n=1 Tax=Legionella longbeachae TaxID=450 RepID=UPI00124708A3|nr:hypothetical protein [Legionella longbeachae]QEY52375.1 hypothetical protein FQU71_14715 [Legionella longbeachae]